MIAVRNGRPEEFLLMAESARAFHASTAYREIEYDLESAIGSLWEMHAAGLLLFAEEKGAIIGGIGGMTFPMFFNANVLVGYERFWWLQPEYRRSRAGLKLMDEFEQAVKSAGCHYLLMTSMVGEHASRAHLAYQHKGYQAAENLYLKRIV